MQQRSDAPSINAQDTGAAPVEDTSSDVVVGAISTVKNSTNPAADDKASSSSLPEGGSLSLPALSFVATAYSLRGRTASGKQTTKGIIAADRRVLPIGTRVRLEAGSYSGEYLVADTGGAVRGRKIDIWVPSTGEAMRFGRRPVKLTVLSRTRPRTIAARKSL
ncbi:MAG TPA: 3D domain-containing protein [Pyrinomonadaceae bacterium]|nr:3D domain-containing protein [Pyrinomonadaceae bacterium]